MSPSPLRAVLCDAAGTLFRVRGSVGAVYASVAARHGIGVDPETIEHRFRTVFRAMPPLCFPGVPDDALSDHERQWWKQVVAGAFHQVHFSDFEAFFEELFVHFARADAWELFPDTRPALTALRARGLRLAIVSNFDGRLVPISEGLGIAEAVDAIVMSSRVGYAKPDARIFAVALRSLDVSAADTLHVGDSATEDVAGALAAGLRALRIDRHGRADDASCLRDLRQLVELA